jgi:hypothetical protein
MDVVVALLVPVLVLGMREYHADHWYQRTAWASRQVTLRTDTCPIARDDLMESGDGRIVGHHNRDSYGDPAAVCEAFV